MITSKNPPKTIDEYIETFPLDIRKVLEKVRQAIKKSAPDAKEAISYQIPTFKLNGNLVHFAGWISHIGFYPGPKAIQAFKKDLVDYEVTKGTIKFPLDKKIPYDLITKITKYRVEESLKKKKLK